MEKRTYNRREIFQKINQFEEYMHKFDKYESEQTNQILSLSKMVRDLLHENDNLKKDIDLLTKITEGNLGEAPGCQFFMLKSYRNAPVVIKDGKLLSHERMKSINISWDACESDVSVDIDA